MSGLLVKPAGASAWLGGLGWASSSRGWQGLTGLAWVLRITLFSFLFSLVFFFYYESNTVIKIQRVENGIKRKLKVQVPSHSAHTNPLTSGSCSNQCHMKPSRYFLAYINTNIRVVLFENRFLKKKRYVYLKNQTPQNTFFLKK